MKPKRTPAQIAADVKRTGRPRVPAKTKRGTVMTIAVTAEEKRVLKAEAKKAGHSVSALLLRPWRKES